MLSGEQQALPYKSTQCTSEGAERGPQSDFPLCSLCHLAFTLCLYYQAWGSIQAIRTSSSSTTATRAQRRGGPRSRLDQHSRLSSQGPRTSPSCSWYMNRPQTHAEYLCAARRQTPGLTLPFAHLYPHIQTRCTQVVQGGPGTLATVESIALAGKPIVVLSDSGGAATAVQIAYRSRYR